MNDDTAYVGALISSISMLLFCMALFLAAVVTLLRYVEEQFRRFRRWRRRRAQRPVFATAVALRQGLAIKLRVDEDAHPLRHPETVLAEPWPQHEADVNAWIRVGSSDVSTD
jgi:hypothetical protein